jgi:hypothetical protein
VNLTQSRYLTVKLFSDRKSGGPQIIVCNYTRIKRATTVNENHANNFIGEVFKERAVLSQNDTHLVKVETDGSRKQVQIIPSLFELFEVLKPKVGHPYVIPNVTALIRRIHNKLATRDLLDHSTDRKSQSQIETNFFPIKFDLVSFTIRVNLCHRTTIRKSTAPERDERGHQRLPFAQIESHHHDQHDTDRSRNARPFRDLHFRKMPRIPILVERVAA